MHHRTIRRFVSVYFFFLGVEKKAEERKEERERRDRDEVIRGFSQSDLSTLGFLRNYRQQPLFSLPPPTPASALWRRREGQKRVGDTDGGNGGSTFIVGANLFIYSNRRVYRLYLLHGSLSFSFHLSFS